MVEEGPKPDLLKLALAKCYSELHAKHRSGNKEAVEALEYEFMMLLMTAQTILTALAARKS